MKLSTAFALLGAASRAFPGVFAHEMAALRGFLPEDFEFLGAANCYSVATEGCGAYNVNSCANLENSGCGCRWDGSTCVNDSCNTITNSNVATDVCESSTRDCAWNYDSSKCQDGNSNRSCNGLSFQNCRDANGCTFIEPENANSYCVSVVNAGDYCTSSPRNQNENKCLKAGCEWYPMPGSNGYCDIPCSYYDGNNNQCKKSGCSYSNGLCELPDYVFDFEAALESSN